MPIDGIVRAVNLLPSDFAGAPKASGDQGARPEVTGGAGPFVVLGVLAACVAGAAGYVVTDNTVKQRKADLASVQAQQQAIESQKAALKPFADFASLANSRVTTVRDLAGSRFDWEQSLRDLSRAIPADVTLKTLNGSVTTDAGGGASGLRSAISAPAITMSGCAPGQTQVARLMARLRSIDGVTRVSLSKSSKAQTQGNTVSASGGSGAAPTAGSERERRNAAPCGTGSRPNFDIVIFFENSSAAVQSSNAAGATTASPSATATATPSPGATATPTATPGDNTTTASTSQGGATP
jgi:Tfp pilus assembly protein PilN